MKLVQCFLKLEEYHSLGLTEVFVVSMSRIVSGMPFCRSLYQLSSHIIVVGLSRDNIAEFPALCIVMYLPTRRAAGNNGLDFRQHMPLSTTSGGAPHPDSPRAGSLLVQTSL